LPQIELIVDIGVVAWGSEKRAETEEKRERSRQKEEEKEGRKVAGPTPRIGSIDITIACDIFPFLLRRKALP
jgi:hypothetical protein